MICFSHSDTQAVAFCCTCAKGLCHECRHVVCHKSSCNDPICNTNIEEIEHINIRAKQIYGIGAFKGGKKFKTPLMQFMLGFFFLGIGVMFLDLTPKTFSFGFIGIGMLFMGMALHEFFRKDRINY